MNEIKDLVNTLDGYITETKGFAVEYAKHDFDNVWSFKVKAYEKKEEEITMKGILTTNSDASILTIAERLKRSGDWELLKAEKVSLDTYEIEVLRVKDEEETCTEK